MNNNYELERARKDAETWRRLLAGAKTKEGERMALNGLADAHGYKNMAERMDLNNTCWNSSGVRRW